MQKITFVVDTDADPSSLLDAAIEAIPDLLAHIEATGVESAFVDENEVSVEEVEE